MQLAAGASAPLPSTAATLGGQRASDRSRDVWQLACQGGPPAPQLVVAERSQLRLGLVGSQYTRSYVLPGRCQALQGGDKRAQLEQGLDAQRGRQWLRTVIGEALGHTDRPRPEITDIEVPFGRITMTPLVEDRKPLPSEWVEGMGDDYGVGGDLVLGLGSMRRPSTRSAGRRGNGTSPWWSTTTRAG